MATINLATAYSKQIAKRFTTNSFVGANVSQRYSFDGVRSIVVSTPITTELVDYDRTKVDGSRFGTLSELEDEIQTLTLTQEKSFNKSIDRGNYTDTQMKYKAGDYLKLQIQERVVPMLDSYCFNKWTAGAGTQANVGELTEKNIVKAILQARIAMNDALVPSEGRVMYISSDNYVKLLTSPEYLNLQKLGEKAICKGDVGRIGDMRVIEVPGSYFPSDLQFLITYKESVLHPVKLKTARVLTEDSNVDGWIVQGRWYFDAFVLEALKMGVYAALSAERTDPTQPNT